MRFFCVALVVCAGLFVVPAQAQYGPAVPFELELVETTMPSAPGLHSFAFAQHQGRWLFVSGRTNGLHGFAVNPFPLPFANNDLWVMNPETREVWSASLDALPDSLADPLRSTNTQYAQVGESLYVFGGYGHSNAEDRKITFPTLTALQVPALIDAVINGTALEPHIRQITDSRVKVTGGEMEYLDGRFYLAFGHDFDGEYSRSGLTFTQAYTEQVRSFRIEDDGTTLAIADYEAATDTDQFHRRDLTTAPVVYPDGTLGWAAYGGVFQKTVDLPFLNPIYMKDDAYTVDWDFEQRMSHYTCPAVPLFDARTAAMHTTFFGGIGMYYYDDIAGELVPDDLVPFLNEITTFTRHADGTSSETIWPVRLPARLGSNAVFIPAEGLPHYANEVIQLHELDGRTFVGWMYGGILAERPNITPSSASNRLFEIYVTPLEVTATEEVPTPAFHIDLFPNPVTTETTLTLRVDQPQAVQVRVYDMLGRQVAVLFNETVVQETSFAFDASHLPTGVYAVQVEGETVQATRLLVR